MTTITTGAASENGSTSADRVSAGGSKPQTIRAAIKGLFKDARRRKGETESDLRKATVPSARTDANGRGPADRETAGPDKARTIFGAIKEQFRKVKAITQRGGDEPQPKARRRKGGEDTRDAFPAAARKMARRAIRQPLVATTIFLSETLDWLNIWHHHDFTASSDHGGGLDTVSHPLSPHP